MIEAAGHAHAPILRRASLQACGILGQLLRLHEQLLNVEVCPGWVGETNRRTAIQTDRHAGGHSQMYRRRYRKGEEQREMSEAVVGSVVHKRTRY